MFTRLYFNPHLPLPHDLHTWTYRSRLFWVNMSGVRIFHLTVVTTLLLSSLLWRIVAQDACTTTSQANPIAQLYPNAPTGTFNATLAIIPIPLAQARQLIPSQYAILEGAYRALLPSFPDGMYPVLMQAGLDHDIQVASINFKLPDFQVSNSTTLSAKQQLTREQRFGWSFPFLDLLGDGSSSFTWAPTQMISASNEMAVNGSRDYGTNVFAATFEPGCEASVRLANGSSSFRANATDDSGKYAMVDIKPLDQGASSPFPLEFYQNITNQPIFANGTHCDNQIRLFNSTINQPQMVKVSLFSNVPPLDAGAGVQDMFGMVIDTPFVEFNGLDCATLKGYSGTGPGD